MSMTFYQRSCFMVKVHWKVNSWLCIHSGKSLWTLPSARGHALVKVHDLWPEVVLLGQRLLSSLWWSTPDLCFLIKTFWTSCDVWTSWLMTFYQSSRLLVKGHGHSWNLVVCFVHMLLRKWYLFLGSVSSDESWILLWRKSRSSMKGHNLWPFFLLKVKAFYV